MPQAEIKSSRLGAQRSRSLRGFGDGQVGLLGVGAVAAGDVQVEARLATRGGRHAINSLPQSWELRVCLTDFGFRYVAAHDKTQVAGGAGMVHAAGVNARTGRTGRDVRAAHIAESPRIHALRFARPVCSCRPASWEHGIALLTTWKHR
jgi:hypothetical protein